jgi:hypothetical protein
MRHLPSIMIQTTHGAMTGALWFNYLGRCTETDNAFLFLSQILLETLDDCNVPSQTVPFLFWAQVAAIRGYEKRACGQSFESLRHLKTARKSPPTPTLHLRGSHQCSLPPVLNTAVCSGCSIKAIQPPWSQHGHSSKLELRRAVLISPRRSL